MKKEADPNLQNVYGDTPLNKASYNGDVAVVTTLLEYGADPNGRSKTGYFALYYAAQENKSDVINVLLN